MGSFVFKPNYELSITKRVHLRYGRSYLIRKLVNAQATLSTSGQAGTATFTIADPGGEIAAMVQPHAMDIVHLQLNSFVDESHMYPAWTGYIDSVQHLHDPTIGDVMNITCTDALKIYNVTTQKVLDPSQFGVYIQSIQPSGKIFERIAKYVDPVNHLAMDTSGIGDIPLFFSFATLKDFTDPDQQSWGGVLSSLCSEMGLEHFADELGVLIIRQYGYYDQPVSHLAGNATTAVATTPLPPPRKDSQISIVTAEAMLHAEIVEADIGVVTSVEVRYAFQQNAYVSATAYGSRAHSNLSTGLMPKDSELNADPMIQQLGYRTVVTYAPWLTTLGTANWLATTLLDLAATNTLTATIVVPANPKYKLGTMIRVRAPRRGLREFDVAFLVQNPNDASKYSSIDFYISSIAYDLAWGGQWIMVLGLSHGRAPDRTFPYFGTIIAPQTAPISDQSAPPQAGQTGVESPPEGGIGSPQTIGQAQGMQQPTTYAISTAPTLPDNDQHNWVYANPNSITPGTVITLSGGNDDGKNFVKKMRSLNGQYTVKANPLIAKDNAALGATALFVPAINGRDEYDNAVVNVTYVGFSAQSNTVFASQVIKQSKANLDLSLSEIKNFKGNLVFGNNPLPDGHPQTQRFGYGTTENPFHSGIDFSCPEGTTVFACVQIGYVAYVGEDYFSGPAFTKENGQRGYGNMVIVNVGRWSIYFGHLSRQLVALHQIVTPTTVIGLSGNSGYSFGGHLHFGVGVIDNLAAYYDPKSLLQYSVPGHVRIPIAAGYDFAPNTASTNFDPNSSLGASVAAVYR